MYRVMFSLTAISFSLVILLMPLFAEAKTYKDTDAVRVEYQSFNGVSIWGEKGDAIDAHGYIWRPDPSEFSGQRPAISSLEDRPNAATASHPGQQRTPGHAIDPHPNEHPRNLALIDWW